jgi:hypothetical protein
MTPWPLWQRRRIADLQTDGLPLELAMRIGKAETVKRQRLSRIIGWRAARAAELNLIEDGDQLRFAISGSFAGLSADQRKRLLDLPNLSPMIAPKGFIHS